MTLRPADPLAEAHDALRRIRTIADGLLNGPTVTQLIPVTERQAQIVREFLDGAKTNEQVGKRLYLSVHTIKTHMKALYRVTGCHDRTSLVLAITTGRITLDPDVTQED